jgi:tetratricopeptide (TPR) repeat protein
MKTSVLSQRLPGDRDLNCWIRRAALILVVGSVAFTAFYLIDRWRPAPPAIVDQQLAALEEAVRTNPSDVASRGGLADTYVKKARYADAIVQYSAILETDQYTERAHFGRGAAYLALGELDAAAKDYGAVVDIAKGGEMANVDPTLQAAYYSLGSIAVQQHRPEEAIPYLEKALRINRADADAMYLLGTVYSATGQADKAATLLRASVVFVPVGWPEPYLALGDAYASAGKPELAAWAQAMAALADGKPALAEPALKALVAGPAALDAAIGLGLLYETTGDPAASATWYRNALAIEPQSSSAVMGLGRVAPGGVAPPAPAPTGGPVPSPRRLPRARGASGPRCRPRMTPRRMIAAAAARRSCSWSCWPASSCS